MVRTTGKKSTPKINSRCGERKKYFVDFKNKTKQTNGKLVLYLYINRPILWVLQAGFRLFTSDKDCNIESSKPASTEVRNWDTFRGLIVVALVPGSRGDCQQGNWWCRQRHLPTAGCQFWCNQNQRNPFRTMLDFTCFLLVEIQEKWHDRFFVCITPIQM